MKKILFLLSIPTVLAACVVDSVEKGDTREVEIRLSTGSMGKTRADATDETIKTVDILVFDNSATPTEHTDATFLYGRYAWPKSGDIYNAILKVRDDVDIYFAINAKQLIADAALTEGMTWSQVHEALILKDPDQIKRAVDGLPMWGYRHSVDIRETVQNSFGTVKLARAVASADISVDLKTTSAGFTLEAGHIVYGSAKGYLSFTVDEDNMDFGTATGVDMENPQADFKFIDPEVPAGTTTDRDWRYAIPAGAITPNKIENIFYFYENEGPAGTNGKHYTKVVLEGKWHDPAAASSDDYVTSWYPLAFRDPDIVDGSNARVPVIRNRKFIIVITGVNGDGYPSLDEAKEGEDLNIVYDIIPWDNWNDGDIFNDGSKFISVGSGRNEGVRKAASLYRNAKSTDVIEYTTNIAPEQFKMVLDGGGVKVDLTAAETAAGMVAKIRNEFYEISMFKDGTNVNGETYGRFLFTALKDYTSASPASVLTVTFGRIKFDISICQRNSKPEDWVDGGNEDITVGN